MAITRSKKEEVLASLVAGFSGAKSVVFARNKGLSVADMQSVRAGLREKNITFQVAKKTLMAKAAVDMKVDGFDIDQLEGAVGVAISSVDEVTPAKMIAEFSKTNENLELVAAIVDGKFLGKQEVKALAALPSKDELYAKFMGSLQAPLSGFVGVSKNLIGGFVRALDQIREQKDS